MNSREPIAEVADQYSGRIGIVVGSGAVAAVLICALGVATYGALAAAGGSLLGALIVNASAIVMTLWDRPRDTQAGAIRS